MTVLDLIETKLSKIDKENVLELDEALAEAERLANEFSDVNPVPFRVPLERMAGFSFEASKHVKEAVEESPRILPF